MTILVFGEHNGRSIKLEVLHAVAAASMLAAHGGGDIHLLVVGSGITTIAQEAAEIHGVAKVLVVDSPAYAHNLAESLAPQLVRLAGSYSHVLAASTTNSKNFMPRAAALLDIAQISDISGIVATDIFLRPIYAGSAIATVQSMDPVKFITVRAASFPAAAATGGTAVIEAIEPSAQSTASQFVGQTIAHSERPDLGSARTIVSGGRGLQSAENFKLIDHLADALGAAVGASRAAVDAGYIPNEHQIGQTGKIVAPDLYIAVGISGAIQHLAGMKDSKVIVAINKDSEAPIFQVADYGLVGDLFAIVPELTKELGK